MLGGTYAYRTSAQMLPDQNPYAIQAGIRAAQFERGDCRATTASSPPAAFVNNVTNHHYFTDVEDFWTGPWDGNAVIGQPARDSVRYSGVRLSASL